MSWRQLSQLRVYKVTLLEEEEQIGMQPAFRWLIVETFTGRRERRRFTTEMRPTGDVIWEEQSVNAPSRGRVLSQAVCTDVGLCLGDLQLQSHDPQNALAAFRRAAAPETFPAPTHHPWRRPLHLAPGQRSLRSAAITLLNGCIYIPNVLDANECAAWRQALERFLEPDRPGFQEYQLRSRCVFNDKSLAAELFLRILSAIKNWEIVIDAEGACRLRNGESGESIDICPDEFRLDPGLEGVWSVKGLHEYLRFVKYPQGGFLAKHCDAMYRKSDDERSFFTCMFYLNGNLDGGSTRFLKTGRDAAINGSGPFEAAHEDEVVCTVTPEMGSCLIFFQPGLLHEGEELRSHEKYILRSDVMFQQIPSAKEAGAAHAAPVEEP